MIDSKLNQLHSAPDCDHITVMLGYWPSGGQLQYLLLTKVTTKKVRLNKQMLI